MSYNHLIILQHHAQQLNNNADTSVVMVIETGTETAFFCKTEPNRTETAALCLCIDGSVLKWSSSGVLNVNSSCKSSRPLVSLARWDQRRDHSRYSIGPILYLLLNNNMYYFPQTFFK